MGRDQSATAEIRLSEKPNFSTTAHPSPPQIFLDEFDHVAEEDIAETGGAAADAGADFGSDRSGRKAGFIERGPGFDDAALCFGGDGARGQRVQVGKVTCLGLCEQSVLDRELLEGRVESGRSGVEG